MNSLYFMGVSLILSLSLSAEKVSFSEQIRPLFNKNCTGCHGGVKQAGGFSLLYKERAFGKTDNGIGIVPGKPEQSILYKVITSPPEVFDKHKNKTRRLEHMPMEKEPLSKEEVALIKRWIEEGANWEEHWAYNSPEKKELPEPDSKWPKSRIDHFTLAKMKELGLKPSQAAAKQIILRRLYLDLTGLPPTVEDIKNFLDDNSAEAYEKEVNKLLSSEAYGEKWAGMWLDLARYSDTQGYEKDSGRTIYRYRDEVIKSFNSDTPYNQFLVEQMAGDLLPDPTIHQKILTAYHRNTMTNTEGGTNDEEFRVAAVIDRVNTTWEAFMGTSFGCVQCHTHPYDPIGHDEYYKFMSFLNNTADADRNDESPVLRTPDIYQQKQLDDWNKKLSDLKAKVDQEKQEISRNFDSRYEVLMKDIKSPTIKTVEFSRLSSKTGHQLKQNSDGSLSAAKNDKNKAVFTLTGSTDLSKINMLQLEALPNTGSNGFGFAGNFVLSSLSLKIKRQKGSEGRFIRIEHTKAGILSLAEVQVLSAGKNLALKKPAKQSSTAWAGNADRAVDGNTSGVYDQNSVTHTNGKDTPWWEVDLGSSTGIDEIVVYNRVEAPERLDGCTISILNEKREVVWQSKIEKSQPKNQIGVSDFNIKFTSASATYEQNGFPAIDSLNTDKEKGWALAGAEKKTQTALFRSDSTITVNTGDTVEVTLSFESEHAQHILENFAVKLGHGNISGEESALIKYIGKKSADLKPEEKESIINHLLKKGSSKETFKEFTDLEIKISKFNVATTPIMEELPKDKRRKTRVFIRGNWEDLAEEVTEGTPEVMNKFKDEWPKNRLGMAYWMTSEENPLTARVAVNRFWEQLFGMGIVETLEDFGSQGIKPTHPKLLDDLAFRFMHEHKWSVKSLLKEIVMSSTYRQSSDASKILLEKDPFNHYLARGPRFRLSAEQIRDQSLSVSGLMSRKMYGPSVMPFQPEGVWMTVYNGGQWVTAKDGNQHRRALYTFWKRTSPYPSMEAFDTPSREVCKVRRIRTNTPLQALVTLNDPVYMECAKEFGRWIKSQSGNTDVKLNNAFEKALCRKAQANELNTLKNLLGEIQRDFGKSEEEAWTLVANVILNLDEFLVKR